MVNNTSFECFLLNELQAISNKSKKFKKYFIEKSPQMKFLKMV